MQQGEEKFVNEISSWMRNLSWSTSLGRLCMCRIILSSLPYYSHFLGKHFTLPVKTLKEKQYPWFSIYSALITRATDPWFPAFPFLIFHHWNSWLVTSFLCAIQFLFRRPFYSRSRRIYPKMSLFRFGIRRLKCASFTRFLSSSSTESSSFFKLDADQKSQVGFSFISIESPDPPKITKIYMCIY